MIDTTYVSLIYLAIIGTILFPLIWWKRMLWIEHMQGQSDRYAFAIRMRDAFFNNGNWALIMMLLIEAQGGKKYILHFIGLSICISKLMYLYSVYKSDERFLMPAKAIKITATIVAAVTNIIIANSFHF